MQPTAAEVYRGFIGDEGAQKVRALRDVVGHCRGYDGLVAVTFFATRNALHDCSRLRLGKSLGTRLP